MKFNIEVDMPDRWAPYFLSMLRSMEVDGYIGHSEWLAFYVDGDGDFRPRFKFDESLPITADIETVYHSRWLKGGIENKTCVREFDAG